MISINHFQFGMLVRARGRRGKLEEHLVCFVTPDHAYIQVFNKFAEVTLLTFNEVEAWKWPRDTTWNEL